MGCLKKESAGSACVEEKKNVWTAWTFSLQRKGRTEGGRAEKEKALKTPDHPKEVTARRQPCVGVGLEITCSELSIKTLFSRGGGTRERKG